MSFYVEFYAETPEHAHTILQQEGGQLPESVQTFASLALLGCTELQPVYVKLQGHLYADGTFAQSSAEILIKSIVYRVPKVEVEIPV